MVRQEDRAEERDSVLNGTAIEVLRLKAGNVPNKLEM